MVKVIHARIAKTAQALARVAWEQMASEDAFYRANPKPRNYVRHNWRHFIPFARQSLVGILTKDYRHEIALGTYTHEGVIAMKEEVYECLCLDGAYKEVPQPIYTLN